MTRSQASPGPPPRPVRLGRYRYSKLRWRVSVRALDMVGTFGMGLWRLVRPPRRVEDPRRILLVQLDHLGDAVLTSPLVSGLRAAYPRATIEVLASASNRQVFAADPNVDRVRVAEKTWFERQRGRWALLSAVWSLGRSLRGEGYEIGIDVRGDILSVIVLTLAGVPHRVGWAMGGGGFLLHDVAPWVPGRHEVKSRLALLETLGVPVSLPARVTVHVADPDRGDVARRLLDAWPEPVVNLPLSGPSNVTRMQDPDARPRAWSLTRPRRRTTTDGVSEGLHTFSPLATGEVRDPLRTTVGPIALPHSASGKGGSSRTRSLGHHPKTTTQTNWDEPDLLHAGRFGASAPLLAVHLGAGTAAKRWPAARWRSLVIRFLDDGWRVVVIGGPEDARAGAVLNPHENLRDWTGRLTVTQTAALLERADLFIGADSGPSHLAASAGTPSVVLFSGTNRVGQWRPWSRRCLVLRHPVACRPCHQKVCPLADHPCMSGLDSDRVYRAAKRWWSRLHRQESPHAPI